MQECSLYDDPELYDLLAPNSKDGAAILDDARRERLASSERFYVEEAKRSEGRVLELACGTGRLTVPIAQAGVDITGIDLSGSMLAVAREKALRAGVNVQFHHGDMRTFDLPEKFSTILIAGNSLLHLLRTEDLKECLNAVRRHLIRDGRLIFDISKWDVRILAREPGRRYPLYRVIAPQRGEIAIDETATYDEAEQIRHLVWYLSAPKAPDFRVIEYSLRIIFPQEISLLLEATGFRLHTRYGEYTRESFESSSQRQVCICAV